MHPVVTKVAIWTLAPEFDRNLVVATRPHGLQVIFRVFFQILRNTPWLVHSAGVGRNIT